MSPRREWRQFRLSEHKSTYSQTDQTTSHQRRNRRPGWMYQAHEMLHFACRVHTLIRSQLKRRTDIADDNRDGK